MEVTLTYSVKKTAWWCVVKTMAYVGFTKDLVRKVVGDKPIVIINCNDNGNTSKRLLTFNSIMS